ncbi:MAG: hypothetical protein ABJM06_11810 [Gilvibacter sp.]
MEQTKLLIKGLSNIDLLTLKAQLDDLDVEAKTQSDSADKQHRQTIQYAFDPQTVVIAISISQLLITVLRHWIKSGKKKRGKGAEFKIEYPDGTVVTITKNQKIKSSADDTLSGASDILDDLQEVLKNSMS